MRKISNFRNTFEGDEILDKAGWMYADLFLALMVIFLATISFVPSLTKLPSTASGAVTSSVNINNLNFQNGLVITYTKFDDQELGKMSIKGLPFKQKIQNGFRIRTFSESVDNAELKWHQDLEDRYVKPLHETDWMVQLDDELPKPLKINEEIYIPEGVWHRVIKGTGELKIQVKFK